MEMCFLSFFGRQRDRGGEKNTHRENKGIKKGREKNTRKNGRLINCLIYFSFLLLNIMQKGGGGGGGKN